MNYQQDDVVRLVRLPYMQLLRADSALRLLKYQVARIDAWGHFLPRYRTILCEPLDFAYRYLCCLGALDVPLLQDLFDLWYRGIVMGAWLAALEPRPEFRKLLLDARPRAPRNQWVVDLAVAAIDGTGPPDLSEHLTLIATIRRALSPIPRPPNRLVRLGPSQLQQNLANAEIVREIYRTQGCEAAFRHLAAQPYTRRVVDSSSHAPGKDGQGRDRTRPLWSWGMYPPVTTEDLMSWKPATVSAPA